MYTPVARKISPCLHLCGSRYSKWIRLANIIAWTLIALAFPPLFAKAGLALTAEFLPSAFSALAVVGMSAVQMLSALSAFVYICIYQLMRLLDERMNVVQITNVEPEQVIIFDTSLLRSPSELPSPYDAQKDLLSRPPSPSPPPNSRESSSQLYPRRLAESFRKLDLPKSQTPSPDSTVENKEQIFPSSSASGLEESMFRKESKGKGDGETEEVASLVTNVGMFRDNSSLRRESEDGGHEFTPTPDLSGTPLSDEKP